MDSSIVFLKFINQINRPYRKKKGGGVFWRGGIKCRCSIPFAKQWWICPHSFQNLWGKLLILTQYSIPRFRYNPDSGFNNCYTEIILKYICVKARDNSHIMHHYDSNLQIIHSVESPSMVDPQWDIWYWGSKWNLHTVCWSAVGCEWGTTSVYFGITYVCFVPSRLPVFAVEPQYLLQDFLFLSKVSFEGHVQNLQKISCWFKIWMRFAGPILIKLWTSCIWGFP